MIGYGTFRPEPGVEVEAPERDDLPDLVADGYSWAQGGAS